jgi:hypothetical protein
MATIVGFDNGRNESHVLQVSLADISDDAGYGDHEKALHKLLVHVLTKYESVAPSILQLEAWDKCSCDELVNTVDELCDVFLVAVFVEDVNDVLS